MYVTLATRSLHVRLTKAVTLMLITQPVSVPMVALAAPTDRTRGSADGFSELTEWAEMHRAAGEHAESARAFAAAYEQLTEHEQGGLKGNITISNAIDDFRLAQTQDPENLALLADELALLELFGEHPQRKDGMPPEIAEELERVNRRIDSLQRAWDAAATPEVPVKEQPRANRRAEGVLIGVGLTAIVGGVALMANGTWNLENVDRRGAELLATIEANRGGSPAMRDELRNDIEDWQREWHVIGTGLVVSGAVLAAVGIGLTTWGAVRMRRAKRRSLAGIAWPIVSGRGVGVALVGRY